MPVGVADGVPKSAQSDDLLESEESLALTGLLLLIDDELNPRVRRFTNGSPMRALTYNPTNKRFCASFGDADDVCVYGASRVFYRFSLSFCARTKRVQLRGLDRISASRLSLTELELYSTDYTPFLSRIYD